MKKLKIIFAFFLISNLSFSQIFYSHYLDATSEWRSYITDVVGTTYFTSYFDGTEDHNGYTYYKKYTVVNEYGNVYLYPSYSLYREDSNGKFYYLNLVTNLEQIDIDIELISNADVGDLFNSLGVLYYDNEACSISSIQTVTINSLNVKHLIGNFDSTTGLVEGIGRVSNPCFASIDSWGGLACYTKQGQVIQFSSIDCGLFPLPQRQGLNNSSFNNFKLGIYPNPVIDKVTVSSNEKINSIIIYDFLGRQILQNNTCKDEITIDLVNLPKGTYFAIIQTDKNISVSKLIKL